MKVYNCDLIAGYKRSYTAYKRDIKPAIRAITHFCCIPISRILLLHVVDKVDIKRNWANVQIRIELARTSTFPAGNGSSLVFDDDGPSLERV